MGMQESPCQGHIIEAVHLRDAIVEEKRAEFDELLDNCDAEGLMALCTDHMLENAIVPVSFFQLSDEDTGDEGMEVGEVYAYYEQSDLYELKPRWEAIQFEKIIGPLPKQHAWTIYG